MLDKFKENNILDGNNIFLRGSIIENYKKKVG